MASDFENLWTDGATALLDLHGESVTQWPAGVSSSAVTLPQAIVEIDAEIAGPIDDADGAQRKRHGRLTLPAATAVAVAARKQNRDGFVIRGLLWWAEDIESEDTALQVVKITRVEGGSTNRARARK